ncbi:3-ketodihydrosphingosine reductase tsc10 [Sphaceloma murrayae]|uniref:3-dehydrosphinganine reductase n=1 Tax=Sphaceloma murrayae TaxID=2082308 RepID=A0A2K1QXW4_9PEZI|nr:3-ketodihydrosphingosine reductase tsc10 [Sphaceloma murrayae]
MIPVPINAPVLTTLIAVLAVFVYVASDVMGLSPSKNKFPVEGRTVLLTGGSQGMGKGLGKLLARKGANLIIVARDKKKLEAALGEISAEAKSPSQRFHYISADVTSPEENTRLLNESTAWNNGTPPDIVWANAGSAHPTLFAETPIATLRSQMDINYWGAAYLSHAAISLFLRTPLPSPPPTTPQPPRHIIMTSSAAALVGLAGYSPYSPCKAAMRNLADTLRNEMNLYNGARRRALANPSTLSVGSVRPPDRDVNIHVVIPGTILSPGLDNENKMKHPVTQLLEEGDPAQTEDEVAAAAIRGLEKGEFMVATTWLMSVLSAGMRGGSPRGNVVLDTVMSWIVSVVWLFMGPELEGKVWGYGKKNGLGKVE